MKRYGIVLFFATALILFGLFTINGNVTLSQDTEEALSQVQDVPIKPSGKITAGPAELRTAEDMEIAEAEMGPMSAEDFEVPFIPTMDPLEYKAAKADAEREGGAKISAVPPHIAAAPTLRTYNFEGINQSQSGYRHSPGPHISVGLYHVVEVVNYRVVVYSKTGTLLKSTDLKAFFGATEALYWPRVLYDRSRARWVIIATRQSTSTTDTTRRFYLAVSKTSDPTGAYWIYKPIVYASTYFNAGDWFSFPMLGMNTDAVIITADVVDTPTAPTSKFAMVFPIEKKRIYSGLSFTSKVFANLAGTLAPPIVLDSNTNAYLIAAKNFTHLHLYRLSIVPSPFSASLVLQAYVAVPTYAVPPDAPQPYTTWKLDTLDGRFLNASTQYSDSLWNVHTIKYPSLNVPCPKFYQIDTSGSGANTVKQQGFFYESAYSSDFNATIAANIYNEAFVTWNSTLPPPGGHQARIRFSGRQPSDPPGIISAGYALWTSPKYLLGYILASDVQWWGPYSAVALDPSAVSGTCYATRKAYIVNEKINDYNSWGTHIARIGFCK